VAQTSRRGPLAEPHLPDVERANKVRRSFFHIISRDERARPARQRPQEGQQGVTVAVAEARSHLSHVAQPLRHRNAHEKSADAPLPAARSVRPSTDDDLLGPYVLDLDPRVGALTLDIDGGTPLGDDSFEPGLLGRPQYVRAPYVSI